MTVLEFTKQDFMHIDLNACDILVECDKEFIDKNQDADFKRVDGKYYIDSTEWLVENGNEDLYDCIIERFDIGTFNYPTFLVRVDTFSMSNKKYNEW